MTKIIWILLAVFLAGLGAIIGTRMSVEAMGVVVGVVLGVAASTPATLLVTMLMSRAERPQAQEQPQPPIVIIQPPEGVDLQNRMYFAGGRWRQIEPPKETN